MTKQPYEDLFGKPITEFKCKKCGKKGKCENGAYVCERCKHVTHEKWKYEFDAYICE